MTAQILSGTGLQSGARVLSSLCSFASLLLISRLPDKQEFGIYSYYITAFAMAGPFINFGANGIAVREMSRFPEKAGQLLGGVIRFKFAGGVLGCLVIALLAATHEADVMSVVLVVLAATHLVPLAHSSTLCVFHAQLSFLVPSLALVAGMAVFLLATGVAYLLGAERAGTYLVLYAASQLVQTYILYFAARRRVTIAYAQTWREFVPFFREMAPIGVSAMAATLYFYINSILLRDLRGEVEVGQFNAAYRILALALMVPTFFTQALFPVLSRHFRQDEGAFGVILQRSFFYLLLLGLPVTCALQILSVRVIGGLYEPAFLPAGPVLQLLSWAMVFSFASSPLITALTAQGRQIVFTRIALGAGAFNVVANLLLIPRFGLFGAALTTVLTEGGVLAACWSALRDRLSVPLVSREFAWKLPLTSAAILGIAWLVREWRLWWAIGSLGLALLAILLLLRCLPVDLLKGYHPASPRSEPQDHTAWPRPS